jgi:Tol biopolymer transport system component
VAAGSVAACVGSKAREWPRIPEEVALGLTLLTPGEYASFQNPTWSPDGHSLAYDSARVVIGATRDALPADAEIYVLDLDTGSRRQLTDNEVADVHPDWSPDGEQIIFARSVESSGYPPLVQLVSINADGGSQQVIFDCPATCLCPKWSPDGGLVAFAMQERIWTIARDGSNLNQASGEKSTAATYPRWSPDGRHQVCWASLEATSVAKASRADLAVLDLSSGQETIVHSGVLPWDPKWRPLGSSILYSDQPAPQEEWTLFILDLETRVVTRLISLDLEYSLFDAAWSPEGTRIAFSYGSPTTGSHLYLLDLAERGVLTAKPTSGP